MYQFLRLLKRTKIKLLEEDGEIITMQNYIGPYWSNGKLQSSVAYGNKRPKTRTDALARLHDTAYAVYPDKKHRRAADKVFHDETKGLAHLLGDIVWYGNKSWLTNDDFDKNTLREIFKLQLSDPYGGVQNYNPYTPSPGGGNISPPVVPLGGTTTPYNPYVPPVTNGGSGSGTTTLYDPYGGSSSGGGTGVQPPAGSGNAGTNGNVPPWYLPGFTGGNISGSGGQSGSGNNQGLYGTATTPLYER